MKGYYLTQKHKDRPIRIAVRNDQNEFVDVIIFATKKGLLKTTDLEYDEEIRHIKIGDT